MKVKSGKVLFFNEAVKKQFRFDKKFGFDDANGAMLLNIYNTYLGEKFNAKEPLTNANKAMIKSVRNILRDDFEIDFKEFVEDLITNWDYYKKNFFSARGVPYPYLKYVYGNISVFANMYKNKIKKDGGFDRW